jgi:hypothetical protein
MSVIESSLDMRLRHPAGAIHDLGPEVLGYMVAELAALSSATIDTAERGTPD